MSEPKTFVEMLDAAQTPEEFGDVVLGLFRSLDHARQEDDS